MADELGLRKSNRTSRSPNAYTPSSPPRNRQPDRLDWETNGLIKDAAYFESTKIKFTKPAHDYPHNLPQTFTSMQIIMRTDIPQEMALIYPRQ